LKLKDRIKPSYQYQLRTFSDIETKNGHRLGDLPAKSITPAAVDKFYERLPGGKEGTKLRHENHTIDKKRSPCRVDGGCLGTGCRAMDITAFEGRGGAANHFDRAHTTMMHT
jgi:hypothetical protein